MENVPVFVAVGRPGVIELRLFQFYRLPDEPASQAMPDYEDAFPQEETGIVNFAFHPGHQSGFVLADFELHRYHGLEEPGKLEGLPVHRFQVGAVNHQRTHRGEGACPGPPGPKPHKLVPHPVPEHLHKMAELVAADSGHLDTQEIGRDSCLPEHFPGIKTKSFSTPQGSLNKVLRNRQIGHHVRHSIKTKPIIKPRQNNATEAVRTGW